MKEIAESFAAAGLTPGFHDAAADIWQRLAPFKDRTDPPPTLEEVIDALCQSVTNCAESSSLRIWLIAYGL